MAARKSTAVEKFEPAGLPDLVQTTDDDFQIDARDIQPPRIKAASPTTGQVTAGRVPMFSLFSYKGRDDADPVVLVPPIKGETATEAEIADSLKVYVLRMYKNKAASVNPQNWYEEMRQGGELRTWDFLDATAPPFARTQYNYVLFVPGVDDSDMPHNLLLTGSAIPTARFINTTLGQKKQQGFPLHTTAFLLWADKRHRTDGGQEQHWSTVKAREAEATKDEVLAANAMMSLVKARPEVAVEQETDQFQPAGDAPSV